MHVQINIIFLQIQIGRCTEKEFMPSTVAVTDYKQEGGAWLLTVAICLPLHS